MQASERGGGMGGGDLIFDFLPIASLPTQAQGGPGTRYNLAKFTPQELRFLNVPPEAHVLLTFYS